MDFTLQRSVFIVHNHFRFQKPPLFSGNPLHRKFRLKRLHIVTAALNGPAGGKNPAPPGAPSTPKPVLQSPLWKKLLKKALAPLSSFKLAIAELALIAILSALGIFIDQNGVPEFYFKEYPEEHPYLGVFSWKVILACGLDHIYTSSYFLGLIALLAASLVACSFTRQVPIVKVAKRWSFMRKQAGIMKLEVSETVTNAKLEDVGVVLMGNDYEVFNEGQVIYAFKGLAGRLAPIGVHASLLLIMAGGLVSALGGYHGNITIPEGLDFRVGDTLSPNGILAAPYFPAMDLNVHVNDFRIETYPSGEVKQFYSDLSVSDSKEGELLRKVINVNNPLRIAGATIYQTDWGITSLFVRLDDSELFSLAMGLLRDGDNKLFGTVIPEGVLNSKGITILARDLESVVIYDKAGQFVGVRRVESHKPIEVDGVSLVVDDILGSTGLQLKIDPAVPVVYAGFGALMFTSAISYLSHSQVWALQEGTSVVIGGKSNRAKISFEEEFIRMINSVPEHVSSKRINQHET